MDALKVAVVGLGVMAQVVYVPLLLRRREVFQVVAVCDLDGHHAETIGRDLGVPAYDDASAMMDKGGFDAVIVLTRGSHGRLVKAALDRGCWVLCESPLAYSKAELSGIPPDARLMVSAVKQYDPATHRLLEGLHEAGGARVVRHLDAAILYPSDESQLLFARARASRPASERLAAHLEADDEALTTALGTDSERLRRLYSQVVLGGLCHELSLMRLLTGEPDTVDHVSVWPADVFPPSIEVSGTLPHPACGRYGLRRHYMPGYPAYHETVTVHHEHGSLELNFPTPYLLNAPATLTILSRVGTTERKTLYRDVAEAFERQLIAFHRFVTQDELPLTGIEGALTDIVTAQRIIRRYAHWAGIPVGGECAEESERKP
jgi:predicted dehydrogenase